MMTETPLRVETQAIRLLRDGNSPTQVAERLNITRTAVEQLARDYTAAAAPRPAPAAPTGPPRTLPIDTLDPHPLNVRSSLGDLTELAASIRQLGVLQPLLVTPATTPGRYTVIAGHRRLAAAHQAGLHDVPVVVRARLNSTDVLEAMLAENLQRADLNPIEEANAYQVLIDLGRTQTAIAKAVGKSDFHINRRLALLELTDEEQQLVIRKEMTLGDATVIAVQRRGHGPNAGTPKRHAYKVPWFTRSHPLAAGAKALCDRAQHAIPSRLGPACGSCWEQTIRASERARSGTTGA